MKSSKKTNILVATLVIILTVVINYSAQAQARIARPPVIIPPTIPELNPYLRQHQNLPVTNPRNPYEWVGQYHNASLDYIGAVANNPAAAARIIGPSIPPTFPCWPNGEVIWRVNQSLFKPYAPEDVLEAIDERRSYFSVDQYAPNARWKIMQGTGGRIYSDKEDSDFNEFNLQLTGLTMALGKGRISLGDYQQKVVELEDQVLQDNSLSENVRMRILLSTTVGRHSAYYHLQSSAAVRKKCPTCVTSDIAGATAGASIGGIWGAVVGAVAMSALDYYLQ